jgi:mannose-6-phosphate isomerase-like protein (cupin superfamily)
MHLKTTAISLAIVAAFAAGTIAAPFLPQMVQAAHAAAAPALPTAPQIIDVTAMKGADLPLRPNSDLRTLTVYSTSDGSIAVQSGTVPKHTHQQNEEVQYILEGTGSMWVGNERKDFRPGMLIVIPRGVAHGGASASYKALAIKLPLPVAGDTQLAD